MRCRVAWILPFAFLLGCGAAPPPPAAAPPPAGAGAAPISPAATAAPAEEKLKKEDALGGAAAEGGKSSVSRATSSPTDAPLISTITQDAVIAQVAKNSEAFNRCYALGAGKSKTWRAKVTVKATVGPAGTVNAVDVKASTAKNPRVDACVVESFKKLVFPRPKNAGTTTFTFPLSFDGVEQVQ